MNWQTYAAIGIIAITLVIFIFRLIRPQKKSGCGHDCGCDKPKDR